ncbi:bifunctional adenosylcobinamide kinase/adenosylcobinamide-phosphate guanylyltransferase [Vibrio panuliri]|uniref:Bifunctional adenosylcobalamin biosynthesis protein n=1 Tax=Vibrio panuliri TaxID=1381081 RepID=A0ABX3FHL3_9VIBR|nr:bifunctional adenosylcobinamide kinase/adenosylcobinamide-phosphate guanylyltransferase [Vibrio panuliri]KAB1454477.1 bifunctional adenosylcobinamide kinase/adenosylcobinamide-phosphate guanylyltransferase [Vibrio panuliri]OLQ90015.1 bifunctional adenosylcobinamide kinase/adenosylcobinamide-phosphate guanylyltransferase [Vibrio panuliri]
MTVHLILGGARSGKSSFAESQVLASDKSVRHYVATATATDDEMRQRIAHHQARRDEHWQLHEEPLELVSLLRTFSVDEIVLVDCLTLWMSNVIFAGGQTASEEEISRRVADLVSGLEQCAADVILVSNEVGLGVVPMGEVTRLFVDHAGWMNQAIAKVAKQVTFVAAGLPMKLKG